MEVVKRGGSIRAVSDIFRGIQRHRDPPCLQDPDHGIHVPLDKALSVTLRMAFPVPLRSPNSAG